MAIAHLVELLMAPLLTSVSSLEADSKSGAINSSIRWANMATP